MTVLTEVTVVIIARATDVMVVTDFTAVTDVTLLTGLVTICEGYR